MQFLTQIIKNKLILGSLVGIGGICCKLGNSGYFGNKQINITRYDKDEYDINDITYQKKLFYYVTHIPYHIPYMEMGIYDDGDYIISIRPPQLINNPINHKLQIEQ